LDPFSQELVRFRRASHREIIERVVAGRRTRRETDRLFLIMRQGKRWQSRERKLTEL
jgi:hypothetical protein